MEKGNKISNCAFYVLDTEPEPELVKSGNRNRNLNFSKVGYGTVKNSYGSTTLPQASAAWLIA